MMMITNVTETRVKSIERAPAWIRINPSWSHSHPITGHFSQITPQRPADLHSLVLWGKAAYLSVLLDLDCRFPPPGIYSIANTDIKRLCHVG